MEFFGPVVREDDEPVFHARWEARTFGLMSVAGATGLSPNFEAMRDAMRRLPRDVYLAGYYRRWLGGVENVLVDQGHLAPGELDARVQRGDAAASSRAGAAGHRRPRGAPAQEPAPRAIRPPWPRSCSRSGSAPCA